MFRVINGQGDWLQVERDGVRGWANKKAETANGVVVAGAEVGDDAPAADAPVKSSGRSKRASAAKSSTAAVSKAVPVEPPPAEKSQ